MTAEASATPRPEQENPSPVVAALERGDRQEALTLCVRHHGTAIGRLCMALLGSQAEAEDLTQEILLEAHRCFGNYRGEGSFQGWLFSIARRRCARQLERQSRRERRLRLVSSGDGVVAGDQQVILRERAEQARAAIEKIRPSEREALLLRYASELSFREVGEVCGIQEAAARKRVSRALSRLRQSLNVE